MNSFMDVKTLLFVGLGVDAGDLLGDRVSRRLATPTALQIAIGFVTEFFDTLGIGSFATTTAVYKLREHGAGQADARHAQRRPRAARRSRRRSSTSQIVAVDVDRRWC